MTFAGALDAVLRRAESTGWAGADPYDGLTSRVGRMAIPFGAGARMGVIQATLRSNRFRAATQPPPSINPKGLGLFLGAVSSGSDSLGSDRATALGSGLFTLIAKLAQRDGNSVAWGYPFPWQSRFLWAPAGTPNAVVTATIGWQLLEWAEHAPAPQARAKIARELGNGAALFLSEKLNYVPAGERGSAVSYTTRDRSRIVNVSLLVARLLARASRSPAAADQCLLSPAQAGRMRDQTSRLLQFGLSAQREDGTWSYSMEARGGWIDSFHTGFVLEALLDLREAGWTVPDAVIQRGFSAYEGFFDEDGGGRLFLQPESPFDAHSVAQGIVTYAAMTAGKGVPESDRAAARTTALRIAQWSLDRLWMADRGYFAYRIQGGRRNEQEYIRWVQAWMALGMSVAYKLERSHELIPV